MIASTIGGYLAGRLRTGWAVEPDEVYFRDTAHGLLTWAFAALLSAIALASATSNILGAASAGLAPAAAVAGANTAQSPVVESYVDQLFRTQGARPPAGDIDEAGRIVTRGLQPRAEWAATDRTYLAQVVAARTGLPQAEAERRVSEVTTQAKRAAEEARKAAAKFSLWLAASMLAGALAAALAAVEGGSLRDRVRTLDGRVDPVAPVSTAPVR